MATSSGPPPERPELAYRPPSGPLERVRARLGRAGLVRPRRGRLAAGVLAGLARRFNVSPWALRAAFLVSILLPGPQFLLYVAMWILMPREA